MTPIPEHTILKRINSSSSNGFKKLRLYKGESIDDKTVKSLKRKGIVPIEDCGYWFVDFSKKII